MNKNKISYFEAISQAIREEMLRDEAVLWFGDDQTPPFRLKPQLREEFGPERVIGTPMVEAAFIGSAVGAALMGMRPIADMYPIDIASWNVTQILQLIERMARNTDMTIPMVIRSTAGRPVRATPSRGSDPDDIRLHQSLGLKVVAPSTVYDAKGMLKAAIRDDHPVLYVEHTVLYHMSDFLETLPAEDYTVPLERAVIRRAGQDLTILTYGVLVHLCLRIAQILAVEDNLEIEVLDLRCLSPLDYCAIEDSVQRTKKILFVDEYELRESFGTHLITYLSETLPDYLAGPIMHISAPGEALTALPPARESHTIQYQPEAIRILSAARALAAY